VRQELAPHGKSAQRIRGQEIRGTHGSACGPVIVPVFKSSNYRVFNGLPTMTAHTAHKGSTIYGVPCQWMCQ